MTLACFTPEQVVYPVNIAAFEDSLRERSVQYFLRNLEIAAELGASQMLVSSGWGYLTEQVSVAWERSRESLTRMAEPRARRPAPWCSSRCSPRNRTL